MSTLPDSLLHSVGDAARQRDLHVLEVRLRGAKGTSVLEIVVDREEGSVTLDELGELSRSLAETLDSLADQLPSRYRLEVGSGGLDRPLEHLWQYRKNIGRLLRVRSAGPDGTPATALYRLLAVDGETLQLQPHTKGRKGTVEPMGLPLAAVERATVEPEL